MKDEPAFPMYNELGNLHATGLTKREYFAAMAMQGILQTSRMEGAVPFVLMAERCVAYADALIAELEK